MAGPPSSWRPPWLDTMMPWTPCSTASSASSLLRMPLMMMGRRVRDCSQYTSFQLMEGSRVLEGIPYSSELAASYRHKMQYTNIQYSNIYTQKDASGEMHSLDLFNHSKAAVSTMRTMG